MKITVTDHGDPSVGIFEESFEIEVPFTFEGSDNDEREYFRKSAIGLYSEYSMGRISAFYDFEIEQEIKYLNEIEVEKQQVEKYF